MHKKNANDDFVALSVALDDATDKATREAIDKFLTKSQANFTNLVSEGDPFDWLKKLGIPSYPCVYVFDRENHFVKKLVGEEVDYKIIEDQVARLLKK